MAAPVIESVSALPVTAVAASQVITKPTGVAVGDFLVCLAAGYGSGTTPTIPGFTSKLYHYTTTDVDNSIAVLYRVADASDVSASNYTITKGTAMEVGAAVMYRISGSANEITWYSVDGAGVSRGNDQVLIMAASQAEGTSYTDYSGYTITSADSNPTWTEDIDDDFTSNAGVNKHTFGVARASTTDTSAITAYSLTGTVDVSVLLVIPAQLNGTPTVEHLAVTPTIPDLPVGQTTQNPSVEHLTITPTLNDLDTKGTAPTQWTPVTKNTTTWTNTDKSL